MIKIGLTGGIGAGKSIVGRIFEIFNIPLYDSDFEAKILYRTDEILKKELLSEFGSDVYLKDGNINKKYLSKIVFQDKDRLKKLNQLVHPRIKIHFERWLLEHSHFPYIIKESAILFESGSYRQIDKVIVVVSPIELRIKRVMERDSTDREMVLKKINNQYDQDELMKKADFIIINDDIKAVLPQVKIIHETLLTCR